MWNAVILSKEGGLPETNQINFLENVTSNSIYAEIENLIKDKKKLKLIQKNHLNPLHLIKKNAKILTLMRKLS